jgi:hypothetical protein
MNNCSKTQKLYRALVTISTLRGEVRTLASEMTPAEVSRFISRIDLLEDVAARLLDDCEEGRRVSFH